MDRRTFLGTAVGGLALARAGHGLSATRAETPRVAAVVTDFRYRLHAHVLMENFLEPYYFRGRRTEPGVKVVSLYCDQFHPGDMARDVAKQYGIPVVPTIEEALTLGGKGLAVDGVLAVGEHGVYPVNARGIMQYPRKRFFDEIVETFDRVGAVAPIFNDKHLSYRWDWAKEMVDGARRRGIPFLAGSSVPLAERRPMVELPAGARITSAVSIHGGGVESYDFHGLEVLQSIVEARAGADPNQGAARVQFLQGDALWKAAQAGLWSIPLADAAMAAEIGTGQPSLPELVRDPKFSAPPHGILVTYRDGLRAIMLKVGGSGTRWNFAANVEGRAEPFATRFHVGPWDNRNLFKALSHAIQSMYRAKVPPYPVERTLLTTGILAAAMDSRAAGGSPLDTPWLDVSYSPTDFRAFREDGASWKIITDETPQPRGIDTNGRGG